ncbi:hypothetical protein AHOG_12540 [Actinoalloteichus hoggarensis]|uniref:BetI-type transcriptional repressor C-terminal domain-containing protein n=2 Tax=Actinoalloteichus hoggarensis TaxID=1470176 RepID=A0A221W3D6_9PSEU|nr:hypothetical protein AHOG_12540 [Actinoalloteichus hoggarensis]
MGLAVSGFLAPASVASAWRRRRPPITCGDRRLVEFGRQGIELPARSGAVARSTTWRHARDFLALIEGLSVQTAMRPDTLAPDDIRATLRHRLDSLALPSP